MQTKLDDIADFISDIELRASDARRLLTMMNDYEDRYNVSFRGLSKMPGFRKIWRALKESCQQSLRIPA